MIYLDYSATTPVNKEVLEIYQKVTENFIGNPNSLHKLGQDARKLIDASTRQIENILNISSKDVIYTSGASEANNTVIKGVCLKYQTRGKRIITTELEHSSILEPLKYLESLGFTVEFVKLDEAGRVDLEDFKSLISDDVILVTISSVNSEVGVRQPIEEIARILKDYPKCYFHSDMTQSIGKEIISLENIDFISFSAQKFYGIKGMGCLLKNKNIDILPLIHGGKSTTIYRSGTPNVAGIASLSKALRLSYDNFLEKEKHVIEIRNYLLEKLSPLPVDINSNSFCIPHIVNISLRKIKSEVMLHALEEEDIYVSTTTACAKTSVSPSVYAITKDKEKAQSSIRISLSYLTTKGEIDTFISVFQDKLQILSNLTKGKI